MSLELSLEKVSRLQCKCKLNDFFLTADILLRASVRNFNLLGLRFILLKISIIIINFRNRKYLRAYLAQVFSDSEFSLLGLIYTFIE